MSGNYPKSLLIGQVLEVEQRDIDPFQRAVVRPSVNFERLETVLVITTFEHLDVEGALDDELPVGTPSPTPTTTPTP
jgi:cell shape-determining protein MreC